MIKALTTLAIGLPLAAAALVTVPATAGAATHGPATTTGTVSARGLSDCNRGYFCAWSDDNFSGRLAQWYGNSTYWGSMNDDAESVYNGAQSSTTVPDNVNVYEDANYVDFDICVLPGETYDAAMDDNDYSSHKWVSSC